jgi:hypothetical protein
MARGGGDGERERFWRDAVRGQRQSALTIRAFCRREGLSESGFHWWRRELERRRTKRTTPRRPPSTARFMPVTVTPATLMAAYEVFLPGGVRVLVHASAGERLVDVLSALERPAC